MVDGGLGDKRYRIPSILIGQILYAYLCLPPLYFARDAYESAKQLEEPYSGFCQESACIWIALPASFGLGFLCCC